MFKPILTLHFNEIKHTQIQKCFEKNFDLKKCFKGVFYGGRRWARTKHSSNSSYTVQKICGNFCFFFIGLHALTGFSGIGKAKCIKKIQHDKEFIEAATLLGVNDAISESVKYIFEEYVCLFHGVKDETMKSKVCYNFFTNR